MTDLNIWGHSTDTKTLFDAQIIMLFSVTSGITFTDIGDESFLFLFFLPFFLFDCEYFYAPPQKVAGYYVIPSELLSVYPSVCPSICPSVRQRLNIRVRSITLIPFEIISRNLVQM